MFRNVVDTINFRLDINVIPFNCVVETNFHDRLVIATSAPLVFVSGICIVYLIMQFVVLTSTASGTERDLRTHKLKTRFLFAAVIVVYTVFPIVSSIIFQTFVYDDSLGGGRY